MTAVTFLRRLRQRGQTLLPLLAALSAAAVVYRRKAPLRPGGLRGAFFTAISCA